MAAYPCSGSTCVGLRLTMMALSLSLSLVALYPPPSNAHPLTLRRDHAISPFTGTSSGGRGTTSSSHMENTKSPSVSNGLSLHPHEEADGTPPGSAWGVQNRRGPSGQSTAPRELPHLPIPLRSLPSTLLKEVPRGPAGPLPSPGGTSPRRALPELRQKQEQRRLTAFSWRFLGADISFSAGPTLSALNASFFRYDSVAPNPAGVDWRNTPYITPIQVQYDCASCWAMAAADTVAMATAIAGGVPGVTASTQQICDCAGQGCCSGGWPEDAFAYMVAQGNITTRADYNYWALDGRQCAWNATQGIAGSITSWERVPSYSQDALLKAVNRQPVLVYISASSDDFQKYWSASPSSPSGPTVYDGSCSLEVNHALVVVGYSLAGAYWILKNSWPADGWGDRGYMYIKMLDGPGKCGMLSVNPVYPVNFPSAPNQVTVAAGSTSPTLKYGADPWWSVWTPPSFNPCVGVINPCGAGTCIGIGGIARCACPAGYVEVIGVPTSKCVSPTPCSASQISPCGPGQCMDVGDGSYLCGCPSGYAVGFRVDGAPTCVPANAVRARTYVAQYGDTCQRLQAMYRLSASAFQALNPYLDCSSSLVPGVLVTLSASTGVACTQTYAIRAGDTCSILAYFLTTKKFLKWLQGSGGDLGNVPVLKETAPAKVLKTPQNTTNLLLLNPALNCLQLLIGQQVCVDAAGSGSATPVTCGVTYTSGQWDTCQSVAWMFGMKKKALLALNPGFNCDFRSTTGFLSPGLQLCVAPAPPPALVPCAQFYTVQQGDTCAQIWNAANLSQAQFLYINPGLQCQVPYLFTGQQLCLDSPALSNISDPNYLLYTVQVNDTWSVVQSQFSHRCKPWSVVVPRIATQNGIADWTSYNFSANVNSTLVIPCVPGIGASCGCAPSLPVCGANFVNYPSYCDAQCNFALPVTYSACSACQLACSGRMGQPPNPVSACAAGYQCPWPTWPPPQEAALQLFTSQPLCSYRARTCLSVCSMYSANFGTATNSTCYNSCTACNRVPCSGPSELVSAGSATCPTCANAGCDPYGRACITDCFYWNTFWNPLNP